jgi:hypothetical protein
VKVNFMSKPTFAQWEPVAFGNEVGKYAGRFLFLTWFCIVEMTDYFWGKPLRRTEWVRASRVRSAV